MADVYPSSVVVSGEGVVTTSVSVTLNNLSHSFISDVGMVLVGPTGAAFELQDGAGDGFGISGVTYTLSDSGATQLPGEAAWAAGTYRPASYFVGDSFPSPGPGTTYSHPGPSGGNNATFASVFNGLDPNGTWKLYTADFVSGDGGQIAGGWTLTINSTPEPTGLLAIFAAPLFAMRRRRKV